MTSEDVSLQGMQFLAERPSEGPGPKYILLRDALAAAISEGYWPPGTKLPTEAQLAAHTPYSLGTVQRALRELVDQGLVQRRRGYGTVVADSRHQLESPWHCRFLSDDGKSFLPVYAVVLDRALTHRRGAWSTPLRQGDQNVIRIDRRMVINNEFDVYSRFFVLADRFPEFMKIPLDNLMGANLKVLIVRSAGRPLTALKEQMRQLQLPGYVCKAIQVPRGTTGMLVECTAYAGDDTPMYYQEMYIPPTERKLYVDSRVPSLL